MARNELKLMESAIALAEELNFTRAARKIRVSQPTLTKNISDLEEELGFELFERTRRTVKLNDAGRAYVEEARLTVLHSARAVHAAKAAQQDAEVVLNVGKSPYTDPFLISTLLSVKLPLYPRLRTEIFSEFSYELVNEVLRGVLDLAIVIEPPVSPLLTTVKVDEAPFYIAMAEDDRLARYPLITMDMLGGRCWSLFERRMHPPLYDKVLRFAEDRNVKVTKIYHVILPEESFPLVVAGTCLGLLVKAGAVRIARNGVTIRPLAEDALSLKTYIVSHAENDSKVLSELVRTLMRKLLALNKTRLS